MACIGGGKVSTAFWWRNARERSPLENLGMDWICSIKWIFKKWDGDMDWVDLTQARDRWRAVVNVVMNFRVLYTDRNFVTKDFLPCSSFVS